jgi:hypothetical protein
MKSENIEVTAPKSMQQDRALSASDYPGLPPPPYPEPSSRRVLVVLLTLLLAFVLLFALILILPRMTSLSSQQMTSSNWSGYCVASNLIAPQPQGTSVSASWTVPAVSISIGNSYSATWIGIGGQFDGTLIQTGTEQDSVNGRATYSAWYELLPRDAVTIGSLSISPGDKITASISLSDPNTSTWVIEISDVTDGHSFRKSVTYASSMLSAEWIVEAPALINRIANLADFGQVTFTDCGATLGGETGTISSFPSSRITLSSRQHIGLTSVSNLAAGGSSFTVGYVS